MTQTVGIIGSGIMGSGLAEVTARAGFSTVLRSRSAESAEASLAAVQRSFAKQVSKGRMTEDEQAEALGRLTCCVELGGLAECDLIIESVVEDLDVKKALFAELGEIAPDAILATNTSTLPVVEMAIASGRPEQVCGIHFFNPAPMMSLVEIIAPRTASPATIETATAFAAACGKTTVEVTDRAGFIVNALLFPYLNNAVKLLERGTASAEDIDVAMQGGCNFPMGPLALLDLVGLDTSVAILDALHGEFADPNFSPAPRLRRMVSAGHLGRKSGRGFYEY